MGPVGGRRRERWGAGVSPRRDTASGALFSRGQRGFRGELTHELWKSPPAIHLHAGFKITAGRLKPGGVFAGGVTARSAPGRAGFYRPPRAGEPGCETSGSLQCLAVDSARGLSRGRRRPALAAHRMLPEGRRGVGRGHEGLGGHGTEGAQGAAHAQYLRGRFEQCAQTYRQILEAGAQGPQRARAPRGGLPARRGQAAGDCLVPDGRGPAAGGGLRVPRARRHQGRAGAGPQGPRAAGGPVSAGTPRARLAGGGARPRLAHRSRRAGAVGAVRAALHDVGRCPRLRAP